METELTELAKEIRRVRYHDEDEYFRRYFAELFPGIRGKFLDRMKSKHPGIYEKHKKRSYHHLILTVGDSPEPLVLSITFLKPKKILFLYTKQTESKLKLIEREVRKIVPEEEDPDYYRERIDGSDTTSIYKAIKEYHKSEIAEDETVAIDITGGKKSMIGGASLAAAILNYHLFYVDNEGYDSKERRPQDGKEFLNLLPNPYLTLGDLKQVRAIDAFNRGNYEYAMEMFGDIYCNISGAGVSEIETRYEITFSLAECYLNWGNHLFKDALKNLDDALGSIEKHHVRDFDHEQLVKNRDVLQMLESCNETQNLYSQFTGKHDFAKAYAVNMFVDGNADIERKNYALAIIKYYRTIELIAQIKLSGYKIETGRNLSRMTHLNQVITHEFKSDFRRLYKKIFGSEKNLVSIDGLMDGHIVLFLLGASPCKDVAELRNLSEITGKSRNGLNIIHGISTGSNNFQEIKKLSEKTLAAVFDDFSDYRKKFNRIEIKDIFC